MNQEQTETLNKVIDKISMIAFSYSIDISKNSKEMDTSIVYELASELSKIEAELLTLPRKRYDITRSK